MEGSSVPPSPLAFAPVRRDKGSSREPSHSRAVSSASKRTAHDAKDLETIEDSPPGPPQTKSRAGGGGTMVSGGIPAAASASTAIVGSAGMPGAWGVEILDAGARRPTSGALATMCTAVEPRRAGVPQHLGDLSEIGALKEQLRQYEQVAGATWNAGKAMAVQMAQQEQDVAYLLGAEQQAQSAASSAMSALMQTRLEETHVAQRVATERARVQQAGTQLMQDASFFQAEWEHAKSVLECEKTDAPPRKRRGGIRSTAG
jgi:hypothetical protein